MNKNLRKYNLREERNKRNKQTKQTKRYYNTLNLGETFVT